MFSRRFCRLCLWNDPKLVRLKEDDDRNDESLVHKIEYCLDTKISKDGNHSSYICPKCVHKIDLFYVFKTNCKRADKLQKTSKDKVPQRVTQGICTSNENIQLEDSSEKTLCAVVDEQLSNEQHDTNRVRISHCPSVSKSSPSKDIINTEQCKGLSNSCYMLPGVEHRHETGMECVLEEAIFPAEDLRYTDESFTAVLYNTCSPEIETPTLKDGGSSRALVAENDENGRKTCNITPNSLCTSSLCSDEVMWTSSKITQNMGQQQVLNNSLGVFNGDSVAQPFVLNSDWNELSNYKNGAYNVIYLTGLNENGDGSNFLFSSDQVSYTNVTLYNAFLHDLPLQTVLEGTTYVTPFSPSFIRCSFCEKLFRCVRSHVLHKSVCQKFYQCRHCRKKFVSKILRQLHYLNECAFHRICHDHGYAQGQRHKVTELTLMKLAKVHLHKLHICTKCNHIFRTENHLIKHKTSCQRRTNHCRSILRVSKSWESLKCFENKTLQSLDMYPIKDFIKQACMSGVKSRGSTTNVGSNHCMLRNNNSSVKTRSAVSAQSKSTINKKDISDSTSVLYAVGLVKKN